jgi:hypothetical protein
MRELLQQALDAFETIMCQSNIEDAHIIAKNARYGLREELAKPDQEPAYFTTINGYVLPNNPIKRSELIPRKA